MNRHLLATLALFSLAPSILADDPKERWIGNVDSALAEAKKLNKPVFLTFRCER